MGMHKIVKQMGKVNPKNQTNTITPKKCANLTSLKHHEPLPHTHHKSLHQIDED